MPEKPKRNEPCHCGSGKKYKNCCFEKDNSGIRSKTGMIGLIVVIVLGIIILGLALSGGQSPVDCPPGTVWSDAHQHCH
jgi:hypothetical protein